LLQGRHRAALEVDLAGYGHIVPHGIVAAEDGVTPVNTDARAASMNFLVQYSPWEKYKRNLPPGAEPYGFEERFGVVAQNLWDGLRRKPLSDKLVACCLDRFFAQAKRYLDGIINKEGSEWDAYYGQRYVDHLKVEYSALGGHSQSCLVLCSDLQEALRPDFDEIIEVVNSEDTQTFPHLTQMIYPQYLFEFDKFVDLYLGAVIPFQALVGAYRWDKHLGLAFNPRQVKIFGLS
jgi:hypothetical protein